MADTLDYGLILFNAFGSTTGAENIPMALYSFARDATGLPLLINAKYIDDADTSIKIEPDVYNAPGQSYHGQARPVFLVVRHNQTNAEYRLSASAFQQALEAASRATWSPDMVELQQVVTEDTKGYQAAKVILA